MKKQTLGAMISSLRKEKEWTQAELAEQMCITDKAVSKWERDLSCPDVNSLPKLAELLGVSVDELLQAKSNKASEKENIPNLINLILKALALAMGVAGIVLSILREIDFYELGIMFGIGLTCVAIVLLQQENKDE